MPATRVSTPCSAAHSRPCRSPMSSTTTRGPSRPWTVRTLPYPGMAPAPACAPCVNHTPVQYHPHSQAQRCRRLHCRASFTFCAPLCPGLAMGTGNPHCHPTAGPHCQFSIIPVGPRMGGRTERGRTLSNSDTCAHVPCRCCAAPRRTCRAQATHGYVLAPRAVLSRTVDQESRTRCPPHSTIESNRACQCELASPKSQRRAVHVFPARSARACARARARPPGVSRRARPAR